MRCLLATLLLAPLLSGCLSVCQDETFFRPLRLANGQETGPWSGDRTLEYKVTGDLVVRASDCNSTATGTIKLCFTLAPRAGKTIRFTAPTFQLLSAKDQAIESAPIPPLHYQVYFKINKDGSVEPTSNPKIGATEPTESKEIMRSAYGYQTRYTFHATSPFLGVEDTFNPPLARSIFGSLGWRDYSFVVELPAIGQDEFKIKLPSVEIDGGQHKMPVLLFRRVTDRVCYPGV
ncbi:MAG: hypothetical protein ACYCZQ_13110 [Burkholderiales bacterium]